MTAAKQSHIEVACKQALVEHGIPFTEQYRFRGSSGKYSVVDFFIAPNIVVECEGALFPAAIPRIKAIPTLIAYANRTRIAAMSNAARIEKTARKLNDATALGYITLHVTAGHAPSSPQRVALLIKELLANRNQ